MRAWVLTERGPALIEREPPALRESDLLVRVRACALNRVDLAMAHGHVHGGAGGVGNVLGVEWAGEVVEVGAEAERTQGFRPGDRVMGSGAGAFAELTTIDAARALAVPASLRDEEAAALPVAVQTMHDAVVTQGQLQRGDTLFVQGASSGVGLMALQIGRLLGARLVAGSSTRADKRARLREYGADLALDSRDPGWVDALLAATDGKGVDLLVDQIAGPLVGPNMRATRIGGRIVNVGRLGGMRGEMDFDLHALRRISYVGVTFRTRAREELRAVTERARADLTEPLAAGRLRLPVDRVFALDELLEALAYMREDRHFGKIALRV